MMMMMMMTLMKLVNSATKFRHGIDKFYQPNSGLRSSRTWDEAIYTTHIFLFDTNHIIYICTSYICLIYLCINDIDLIWYNLSSFGFRMWVWGDGGNVVSPIWSERGGSSTIPFFGCKNDGLLPQQFWIFWYTVYIYISHLEAYK